MGALADAVNVQFHEAYDGARAGASLEIPVLVVLENELILVRRGARAEIGFTPELFHIAKSVAHAPIAAFVITHAVAVAESRTLDGASRTGLERLRLQIVQLDTSLEPMAPDLGPAGMVPNLRHVAGSTLEYLGLALDGVGVDTATRGAFARRMGPALLRCSKDATEIQLTALHREVTRALAELDDAERRDVEVVVGGAHQARVRSLAMQYFEKLFGEPPGAELRVSYAEGARSVDEALALVGTRRLDRTLASAFFGDPRRLQRDILGDAAKEHIDSLDLRRPVG